MDLVFDVGHDLYGNKSSFKTIVFIPNIYVLANVMLGPLLPVCMFPFSEYLLKIKQRPLLRIGSLLETFFPFLVRVERILPKPCKVTQFIHKSEFMYLVNEPNRLYLTVIFVFVIINYQ